MSGQASAGSGGTVRCRWIGFWTGDRAGHRPLALRRSRWGLGCGAGGAGEGRVRTATLRSNVTSLGIYSISASIYARVSHFSPYKKVNTIKILAPPPPTGPGGRRVAQQAKGQPYSCMVGCGLRKAVSAWFRSRPLHGLVCWSPASRPHRPTDTRRRTHHRRQKARQAPLFTWMT